MNERQLALRTLIEAETDAVVPPPGAQEQGWTRLVTAVERGASARPDVLDPPTRSALAWKLGLFTLLLAAVVGAGLWNASRDWATVDPAALHADLEQTGAEPPAPPVIPPPALPQVVQSASIGEPVVPVAAETLAPVSRPPVPRRRKSAASPAPEGDGFAAELRLIVTAQAALRDGKPAEALKHLNRHTREFPGGNFAEDRDALRAMALCAGNRRREGERLAEAFLGSHAGSIYAERVRAACIR